jgi:hypothetical protein
MLMFDSKYILYYSIHTKIYMSLEALIVKNPEDMDMQNSNFAA